jgi:hypothetical protein
MTFCLFGPQMAGLTGIELTSAEARMDFRALYGGLEASIGIFLLWCSRRPEWYRPGLAFQICAFSSLVAVRLLSMAGEGEAPALQALLAAGEAATALVGVWAWQRCGKAAMLLTK